MISVSLLRWYSPLSQLSLRSLAALGDNAPLARVCLSCICRGASGNPPNVQISWKMEGKHGIYLNAVYPLFIICYIRNERVWSFCDPPLANALVCHCLPYHMYSCQESGVLCCTPFWCYFSKQHFSVIPVDNQIGAIVEISNKKESEHAALAVWLLISKVFFFPLCEKNNRMCLL